MGLEAPRTVSVGLRTNCCSMALVPAFVLFHCPFKASKSADPLPSFGLGGAVPGITVGVEHGPGACFVLFHCPFKASKASKPSIAAPEANTNCCWACCYLALLTFPKLPWHVSAPLESTNCFCSRGFEAAIWHFRGATTCFYWGFEAAIWHFRGATTCFYWGFETAIWHVSSTP